ncbi:MAG: hypothetical protein LT070_06220 [Solirubrobacteraceae bacterium]|nr:hypothetical protein [Solirubrobacteraceae bacterium]
MKGHLKHLLMCAPMLLVGVVLIIGGAGLGSFVPLAVCMLVMTLVMGSMGGNHGSHGSGSCDGNRSIADVAHAAPLFALSSPVVRAGDHRLGRRRAPCAGRPSAPRVPVGSAEQ